MTDAPVSPESAVMHALAASIASQGSLSALMDAALRKKFPWAYDADGKLIEQDPTVAAEAMRRTKAWLYEGSPHPSEVLPKLEFRFNPDAPGADIFLGHGAGVADAMSLPDGA